MRAPDATDDGSTAGDIGATASTAERIVSLAPSATASLAAMGADEAVVGVTAHCDLDRPVVGGWLNPDYGRLADLDPDVVCTADELQREVRDELRDRGHDVCHVEPGTLDAVIDSVATLGDAVGRSRAGSALAAELRGRVDAVRERAAEAGGGARPVVYCEEWGDPPMAAGNWVPEAVAAAGGRYPFCDPGERSREVTAAAVEDADPDRVVLHHCGHGDRVDPGVLDRRGWGLDATVSVFDDDLLNQPSPRLVDGIERLAALVHGD